jgi:N-acetylglucosaminyl-diphospho-decaprenol L-rhamnosyltransferase
LHHIKTDAAKAERLRKHAGFLMKDFVDIQAEPLPKEVWWVSEANMLVDACYFQAAGGFNPKLRFHDIQDLAMKFHKLGIKRYFDPAIEATHKAIDVREKRQTDAIKAYIRLVGRYGLRQLF